jgi:peptidoglycan hydrolase-like protein with peptidoglycan-binding domain
VIPSNAWAAYNANLRHIPTAENPNRLAARRSVQAALRRLGIYSGQVDGILGPDTHRAIEVYQVKNKLPAAHPADTLQDTR